MKYTFLLPAYKAHFLGEMLKSIQNQSYTDFQVIISDDCSQEDIKSVCKPYLDDTRFTYRRNEKNIGSESLASYWNQLINLCDTEYLIIASDDDIYERRFLEEINILTQQHPNIALYRARVRRINHQGETYLQEYIYEEVENPLQFLYSSFGQDRIHCIGNYVFRREVLKQNGKFVDFPLAWFSDDATCFLCATNGVANTHEILFNFRSSDINISNLKSNNSLVQKKIEATCLFYEWMTSFVRNISFPNTLYNQSIYNEICKRYKNRVKWQLFSNFCQTNIRYKIRLIRWGKNNKLLSVLDICILIKKWIQFNVKSFSV